MSKEASGQSSSQGKQQTSEISQDRVSAQQGSGQNYQPGSQSVGGQRSTGVAQSQRGSSDLSTYGGYGSGPFSTMRRISDEMDRLFESFGLGRGFFPTQYGRGSSLGYGDASAASALWAPHIDVTERDGKLLISADLPGVRKEDVKVEINSDSVTIQGQRQRESTSSDRGYYHSERSFGSFYRAIALPEGVNVENASASFRDGVLQIEVPAPSEQSRGRTLEIKDAGNANEGGSKSGGGGQQQR